MNIGLWNVFPKMKSTNIGTNFSKIKKQQIQTNHSKIQNR